MMNETSGLKKIVAAAVLALLVPAQTLMAQTGAVVTSGAADIARAGNVTNINQSTDRAAINWQTFNIRPDETVNFNQPGAASVTLNRVIGNERSVLEGVLNANGQVFLINSGGILLTKNASVNTGGFLAGTLNITDEDFNAGRYIFQSDGKDNAVINQGTITSKTGGYAALLGGTVSNQGIIRAEKGTVALASGDKIRLNFAAATGGGDSLLGVIIEEGTLNALVENKSAIIADGGQVYLTAKAANELYQSQVNTEGLIQARTISDLTGGDLKGNIEISAHGGTANIGGTLDASAPYINGMGDGGFIETSGGAVKISDSAVITTKSAGGANGEWLIDPDGFTVGMTTNDGDMSASALNANLTNGNVTISSTSGTNQNNNDGNINVNGAVSWSENTLTLNATNNVYVNNIMTATGTAGLTANYGTGTNADETPMGLYTAHGDSNARIDFSGTGALRLGGENYTVINTANQLTAARNNPNGRYALGSNINLSSISNWAALDNNAASGFTGRFNGLGHEISNLTGSNSFFDTIGSGANVSNLRFASSGITVNSAKNSAGFLADVNRGSVVNVGGGGVNLNSYNVSCAGSLVGINHGLIAQSYGGSVRNLMNTSGGLVGLNEGTGRIIDSYSTGILSNTDVLTRATGYVGGLAGINNGTILRSYATGIIMLDGPTDNTLRVGGLVGRNNGTIRESYTAAASGSYIYDIAPQFGGFAGENTGLIENAYSTRLSSKNISSVWDAGFVYSNSGTIRNAYATMESTNTKTASGRYGFAWSNSGKLENVYWYAADPPVYLGVPNVVTEVQLTPGAVRLTKDTVNNFSSYSFGTGMSAAWGASQTGTPILRNIPVVIYTRSDITYGSGITSGLSITGLQGGDAARSPFTIAIPSGGTYLDAGAWNAADVFRGAYANLKGVIRVNPRPLTISGLVENKVYDGTTNAVLKTNVLRGGLSGFAGYETLNITYTAAEFQDKNAGNGRTVNLTYNVSDGANGGKASNYAIATTTTADITPKPVEVGVIGHNRVYDGTTAATVATGVSGVITGDRVSASYASAVFNNKNVGNRNVTVSGIALTGADAGNYTLTGGTTRQTMAFITPLALTFYGMANEGSPLEISAESLTATNIIDGDFVTLGGSVKIAASTAGSQPISDFSGLTVNNTNYTVVGSVGNIIVGGANLVLDRVAAGSADIATSGKTTTVTQTTDKAVIDWMRFSIGADETLVFNQPSENSVVLNRVTTNLPSVIDGALRANGRVFILTGGGVLFTANSSVNVGGLLAGTFSLANEDFLNNSYVFTVARGGGSVISEGDIVITDGGFIALAGSHGVNHTGTITGGNLTLLVSSDSLDLTNINEYTVGNLTGAVTVGGTVNLKPGGIFGIAGDTVTLSNGFMPNIGSGGAFRWEQNGNLTIGDGYLTGAVVRDNLAARDFSLTSRNGDMTINAAIDWSANTTLSMKAGNDIYVNKSIKATGANAGLTLTAGGDYYLITPATFSGAVLDATGKPVARKIPAGTEFSEIALSGANAKLKINGDSYTLIRTMDGLAAIDGKAGHFALMNNLDATAWSRANMGAASVIGTMSGTLAGMGHTVSNLTLNAPDKSNAGLIGRVTSDGKTVNVLRDIGVLNVDITSVNAAGALAGSAADTVISQAYSTGMIRTTSALAVNGGTAGGFAGTMSGTNRIENSYSGVDITALSGSLGGLAGSAQTITIANSHATGNVSCTRAGLLYVNDITDETSEVFDAAGRLLVMPSGAGWRLSAVRYPVGIGGLLGNAYYANINNSWASSNVTTFDGWYIGGLVGMMGTVNLNNTIPNTVTNSFATGNVVGGSRVGGLIGDIGNSLNLEVVIDNVYATGKVIGTLGFRYELTDGSMIGGLIGQANNSAISNAFATGNVIVTAVSGGRTELTGGLVGSQGGGSISDSYATGTIVGNTWGDGLVGGQGGTVSGNSYYSNARAETMAATEAVRSETGRIVDAVRVREADGVRNAVNSEQNRIDDGGNRQPDRYIGYGDSDSYSARVKAISVEDECSEDEESCGE